MASSSWSTTAVGRLALAGLIAAGCAAPARAADFDGSKPLICAVTTVMECDAGQCERYAPPDTPAGAPAFFKVDVAAKAVTASAGRKSTLITVLHINGRSRRPAGRAAR